MTMNDKNRATLRAILTADQMKSVEDFAAIDEGHVDITMIEPDRSGFICVKHDPETETLTISIYTRETAFIKIQDMMREWDK